MQRGSGSTQPHSTAPQVPEDVGGSCRVIRRLAWPTSSLRLARARIKGAPDPLDEDGVTGAVQATQTRLDASIPAQRSRTPHSPSRKGEDPSPTPASQFPDLDGWWVP